MTTIQAIDLLKGLEQSLDDYCELNDEGKTAFRMAITALEVFGLSEQLPSAQQEQPKNGKWTRPFPTRPKTYERFCSECKGKAWYCGTGDYNFCPNCGADMRGEADETD